MARNRKFKNPLYPSSKLPPEKFRLLLWMFSFNRTPQHIASYLGLTPRTVYPILDRLRERMASDELFLQDVMIEPDSIPPPEHQFWNDLVKCLFECPTATDDKLVATKSLPPDESLGSDRAKWTIRYHMKARADACRSCYITGESYDSRIRSMRIFRTWITAFGGIPERKLRLYFVHFLIIKNLEHNIGFQLRIVGKIGTSSVATIIHGSLISALRRKPL